jgi:hypothetical protein
LGDGSTGWVTCQNNGCSMSAAYLAPETAREIFGPSTGILAWGPPGAPYEAQPVEGGYRISGKWRFASGSHHATWLGRTRRSREQAAARNGDGLGVRVTVGMIVGQVGVGRSVDEILRDYPYLEREDVLQALHYAAWSVEEPEVIIGNS